MTYLSPLDLIALTCQFPITVLAWRREPSRDQVFWFLLAAAFLGPLIWSISVHYPVWRRHLPAALWTSIAVTWGVFLLISALIKDAWRLVAVIAPILMIMGVLAVISSGNNWKEFQTGSIIIEANASLSLHIAVSLLTYALVTIICFQTRG